MESTQFVSMSLGIEGELHLNRSQVRVALVGCGSHVFRNVLPALRFLPKVRLQACCDLNFDKARAYANSFGADKAFSDVDTMLEQTDVDCVIVVVGFSDKTGHPLYPGIVSSLLRRGLPVWFEKPPAGTEAEIIEMQRLERSPAFGQVGFKKMFAPATTHARKLLELDEFGHLGSYTYRYSVDLPSNPGDLMAANARRFLDDFVHVASVIVDLVGLPSRATSFREPSGDGLIVLEHASGTVGAVHLSAGASALDSVEDVMFVGQGANVRIRNGIEVEYFPRGWRGPYGRSTSYLPQPMDDSLPGVTDGPRRWFPEFSLGTLSSGRHFVQGYYQELDHFISCVSNGRTPARAGLEDARRVMALMDAIREPFGIPTGVRSADTSAVRQHPESESQNAAPMCRRTDRPFTLKDGWNYACGTCGATATLHEHSIRECPDQSS